MTYVAPYQPVTQSNNTFQKDGPNNLGLMRCLTL